MNLGTLVLGLINGSIIGLLAAGFVLVYKSNRFLNLAHAQLGALSAMLLAKFVNDLGWNFWGALALCLPLGVVMGLVVERFLVRPVRNKTSSSIRLLLLSLGISQVLLALTFVGFLAPDAESAKSYPQPFQSELEFDGVVLSGMSVLTLLIVPVLLVALTSFLEYSSIGKQIRAAANNPQEARLCGVPISRVSLITWGIAGGLSAVAAILSGPSATGFNVAALGPILLVQTLGAAAFGAFVSIPWSVGGGLAIGVLYQVILAETLDAGLAQLTIFGLILLAILLRGKAIGRVFAVTGAAVPELPSVRMPDALRDVRLFRSYRRYLAFGGFAISAAFPLLPYFNSDGNRFLLVLVVIYAMVGVSLTLLLGWAGQVSLGHFALVGLGGFLTARLIDGGWSLLAIIVVVGLIGAAATAVVGLPALRVPGLTLVVTTVGFAVLAPQWLFLQESVGGDTPFTTVVDAPPVGAGLGMLDSQLKLYYFVLVALTLVVLAASSLRRTNAGRAILAVRDNEGASSALGITPATVKLAALALSGFIAAVAGVFWAVAWQRVTPVQFGPEVSTAVLAVPVLGGLGSLAGALAAAVLLYVPTFFLTPHLSGLLGEFGRNVGFHLLLGGLGVVVTMIQFPNGIAGQAQKHWQAYLNRKSGAAEEQERPAEPVLPPAPETATRHDDEHRVWPAHHTKVGGAVAENGLHEPGMPLVVEGAALHFGGIAALDGADIVVRRGEIVGLIGPNGAGKTTLMNVISGVLTPDQGSVRLFGDEVVDLPAAVRPSFGMGRSFQDASLFSGLTVLESVQLAVSRGDKTGMLGSLTAAPWVRIAERRCRRRAEKILASFGLSGWADALTAELSTGTRRICDLAIQVAARPKLILLDEPTGGVAQREAEAFGPLVRRIRDELDCSILIIEHDMPLLMGLCDRVYAMELGRVIAEGTPTEVREDPHVIASYLGTDAAAIDRSGTGLDANGATHRRRQPLVAASKEES